MGRGGYRVIVKGYPYFTTSNVVDWTPVFKHRVCVESILDSLKYLRGKNALLLHAYVIMEDHLHLVISADDVSATMGRFLSHTGRTIVQHCLDQQIIDALSVFRKRCTSPGRRQHQVWNRGFHPKVLKSHRTLLQKIEYIHQNPVRKGLVKNARDWPYSSLTYLQGDRNLPQVDSIAL